MKSERNTSFWVTYSDLATGLMLVFLLIMVVMMFQLTLKEQESKSKIQKSQVEIERILKELTIILGTKTELAKRLKSLESTALKPTVDPLTARIQLRQESINFGSNKYQFDTLPPETQTNVLDFGTQYVCALWQSERRNAIQQSSGTLSTEEYLDPTGPQAIQNIKIMGTADLKGSSDLRTNPQITAARARAVQVALLGHLKQCSDDKDNSCYKINTECEGQDEAIWHYAQERLIAVGLSHVEHCTAQKEALKGDCVSASKEEDIRVDDAAYRRVDFSAEITNSDLSSLLVDMYSLAKSIKNMGDSNKETDAFTNIRAQVETAAEACSEQRSNAQVCAALKSKCESLDENDADRTLFKCTEILNASSNP